MCIRDRDYTVPSNYNDPMMLAFRCSKIKPHLVSPPVYCRQAYVFSVNVMAAANATLIMDAVRNELSLYCSVVANGVHSVSLLLFKERFTFPSVSLQFLLSFGTLLTRTITGL